MFQLSARWLLPKLLVIKAVAGTSVAVVQLIQKLYETKQIISSQQHSRPPVALSPPSGNNTSESNDSLDLGSVELEEVGPVPDEDGFTY